MNRKPTAKQAEALALIEDNPGRVEAITRAVHDALHINGNVERGLIRNGWVFCDGDRGRWALTQAGADALRDHTAAQAAKPAQGR